MLSFKNNVARCPVVEYTYARARMRRVSYCTYVRSIYAYAHAYTSMLLVAFSQLEHIAPCLGIAAFQPILARREVCLGRGKNT